MKLEILKKHFDEVIQIVSKVSNKNLSLPVLGCVVINATPTHTTLKATNLDVSVEVGLKSKVVDAGVVAVPANILTQSVLATSSEKITLESKDGVLKIKTKNSESALKTLDPSDFPTLPYVKDGEGVVTTIPTKEFVHALKNVSFAAATSAIRPELSSVFVSLSDGELVTAATDSFRLAELKMPTKNKKSTDPILIPSRNIGDIMRVVDGSDVVEVRVGENQVTCVAGGNYITSRIIDGAFPEYHAIIPKTHTTTATVLKEDLLKALKTSSVFTDQTGQVEIGIDSDDKTLSIRAANAQVGESNETVDAAVEGGGITMYFNVRYLLDAMSAVSADSVALNFSGPGKPLVLNEVPNKGFTYLVMPMNK